MLYQIASLGSHAPAEQGQTHNHEVLRSLGVRGASGGIGSALGLPQRRRGTGPECLHRCGGVV